MAGSAGTPGLRTPANMPEKDEKGTRMERPYSESTVGESMRILKMAFSRYFKNYALNVQAGETGALLAMLEDGAIKCSCIGFQLIKKLPDEVQEEMEGLAEKLRKRSYSRILYNALNVFSDYRYTAGQVKYGALYYPDLKMYLCIGYLTPKILLKLLTEPDCEQVAVFAAMAKWERKNQYLVFEHGASREEFNRQLQRFELPFLKNRS